MSDAPTHQVQIDGQMREVTIDDLKAAYTVKADRDRAAALSVEQRKEQADIERRAELYDKMMGAIQRDPRQALRTIGERVRVPVQFADEQAAAAPVPPAPAPEQNFDTAANEAPKIPQPNAVQDPIDQADRIVNDEVAQLRSEMQQMREQNALDSARAKHATLQESIPSGKNITFDEVMLTIQQKGIDDYESAFKVLAFERQQSVAELDTPDEDPALQASQMTLGGTFSGQPDNSTAIKDPSTWDPEKRYYSTRELVEAAFAESGVS